jgi:peroxiredoxin Q/BCP
LIRKYDVVYFMASGDTPAANKAFAEKEHADFPILSNLDKKVAIAYGVIAPDAPPERQLAKRWTFYIGPDGKILFIDKGATGRGVNPATSGEDIVAKLKELAVPEKK